MFTRQNLGLASLAALMCATLCLLTVSSMGQIAYGTERGVGAGDIYEIDLGALSGTALFQTNLTPNNQNSPNGNAFDWLNNRLYYSVNDRDETPSALYFYDFAGNQTYAGMLDFFAAGAAYYNGSYYYVANATDNLRVVGFNPNGTIATEAAAFNDFTAGSTNTTYRFGDIAITCDGILYGSALRTGTQTIDFFRIDLILNVYTLISTREGGGTRQLAFGTDGALYSHNAGDGSFYDIDVTNGNETFLGVVDTAHTDQFSDLASGQVCGIEVGIDIKPNSYPNCFNNDGHGLIPVAILGSDTFDVTSIDASTLEFQGLKVRMKGNGTVQCSIEDVSGDFSTFPEGVPDGYPDLVCKFVDEDGIWDAGTGEGTVTGELFNGPPFSFSGTDTVCVTQ